MDKAAILAELDASILILKGMRAELTTSKETSNHDRRP
jgi:hypothetical protein